VERRPDPPTTAFASGGPEADTAPEATALAPRPARPAPRLARQLQRLIVVRLVVVTSIVLPYFLLRLTRPEIPLSFDLLFQIAAGAYLANLVYLVLLRALRDAPIVQSYLQFGGDLLLVTALVYYFGDIASPFSLFYLVVITVASVFLGRRGGLVVATSAYILYGALLTSIDRGLLERAGPALLEQDDFWRLPYNLVVHLFGFYAVALLTSFLAERYRETAAELVLQRDSLANFEAFHRDVVQSLSTGILTTDTQGRTTSINRAALEILGRPEEEVLGWPIDASGLFRLDEWRELARQAERREGRQRADLEVERGDRSIPIGYSLACLADAGGQVIGTAVVFQDLSEWRALQEELRLKDRMAAVGELSAGLAHELGNPLAAMAGSVQLLSASHPEDDSQRRLLDIILRESQRLDRTIKGFLRFARPRERSVSRFDIAALAEEHCALLRNSDEASERHEIAVDLDPPHAQIQGDRDQISQILWNLSRNALRAMPEGGRLVIRGRLDGDAYALEIEDSGRGMTEAQRQRLFQPFRSFFDAGTGIGMAIVYRIVQEHRGRIDVDSAPGRGTTIRVRLPTGVKVPVAQEA